MKPTRKSCPSFYVLIHVAGDFDVAKQACREFCFQEGLCVTVTETAYIYTGGEEAGVTVRLMNYPRFPKKGKTIWEIAERLGEALRQRLCQHSFCLESPKETQWVTYREDR